MLGNAGQAAQEWSWQVVPQTALSTDLHALVGRPARPQPAWQPPAARGYCPVAGALRVWVDMVTGGCGPPAGHCGGGGSQEAPLSLWEFGGNSLQTGAMSHPNHEEPKEGKCGEQGEPRERSGREGRVGWPLDTVWTQSGRGFIQTEGLKQ